MHSALLFTPIPQSNASKIYTLPRKNTLKQSLPNLQLVIRQQDQAFDKQCILPVNKAEVAVSGKSSSYINYYITDMCHKTHHYPDSAYSFSFDHILQPLNICVAHRPIRTPAINYIKPKCNNRQELVNKIRYLESQT